MLLIVMTNRKEIKMRRTKERMPKQPDGTKYNWGYNDGLNASSMKNPIHRNWKGKDGILRHFDEAYVNGYIAGYAKSTGTVLTVLIQD